MVYFNTQYLLYMAPAIIAMLAAQWYVKSTYNKWGKTAIIQIIKNLPINKSYQAE
jgi:Zn-dependent membrane protease YugP